MPQNIRDVMTSNPCTIDAEKSVAYAAKMMLEEDVGLAPIVEGDKLIGMLTDRDIAVRCIAEGKGPNTKVRDAMSQEVLYCFEDEDTQHICQNMADIQVRRLPVMNRNKRLVGIVSLSDLARKEPNTAKALHLIARPGEQHNQSRLAA